MKKIVMNLFIVAAIAGSMSACTVVTDDNDPYYHAWYDVYGNYCGKGYPTSGCDFYANGAKITASGDPYSANETLYYDSWNYTDSYGYHRNFTGFAWLSNDGILYDANGNALNEMDSSDTETVDVLSQAAAQASAVQQAVGHQLSQKYALSDDKGLMISQALQDWATLAKDRSRTPADVANFAKRLYGIDPVQATAALSTAAATQNSQALEGMNADIAAYWGTTPEVSKQILKTWYQGEASQYGVQ